MNFVYKEMLQAYSALFAGSCSQNARTGAREVAHMGNDMDNVW